MSINSTTYYGNLGGSAVLNPNSADYVITDPFLNTPSPNKGLPYPTSTTIKLISRKTSFAPNTLGNTQKVYTTPYTNDVNLLCNYYVDFGCSYEVETGPVYKVTINVPFDEITQQDYYINKAVAETWEITPNVTQKSLAATTFYVDSSKPLNTANNAINIPDPIKAAIYFAYNNQQSVIVPPASGSVNYSSWIPYAQGVLNLMRAGVTNTYAFGQSLKRTMTVDIYNSQNAFTSNGDNLYKQYLTQGNKGIIYSRADMTTAYSIPQTVQTLMLPSYAKYMTVYSSDPTKPQDKYPYVAYGGFMVMPPTFQFITRNKVQLTQQFIWDEWVSTLYFVPNANDTTKFPPITPQTAPF